MKRANRFRWALERVYWPQVYLPVRCAVRRSANARYLNVKFCVHGDVIDIGKECIIDITCIWWIHISIEKGKAVPTFSGGNQR